MVPNGDSNNAVVLNVSDLILTKETWKIANNRKVEKEGGTRRPGYGTIGARCDVKAKGVFHHSKMERTSREVAASKNVTVDKYLSELLKLNDLSNALSDATNREEVKKALEGVIVETDHLQYKRRYKVVDLATVSAEHQFTVGTVQYSVSDYFSVKHGIKLKQPNLPCLQVWTRKPEKLTYLPMEVCKVVRTLEYLKELDQKLVTALRTCNLPAAVDGNINKEENGDSKMLNQEPGTNKSEVCDEIVNARVLPPPRLKFNDSGMEREIAPRHGHWNMKNKIMREAATVEQWICLSFSVVDNQILKQFCDELVAMCSSMGMKFSHPREIIRSPDPIKKTLLQLCKPTGTLQLLIIILPEKENRDSYEEIKRICDTEIGIVSQCCKSRHLSKLSRQYLQSLALKINVKVGGGNTVLLDAINTHIPLLTDLPTIVFGADVLHTPREEEPNASIAAVVASMDWPAVSKYRGLVRAQDHRVEIVHLRDCVRDLLRDFCSTNGEQEPRRIIFFRVGVSESQFAEVMSKEVDLIWQACKSIRKDYEPQVTFVAVQKRHNTLLSPIGGKKAAKEKEILAGTVIDTNICHPTEFNFYLCSHAGKQENTRPTLYHVLYDENNFTADLLQLLINSLCYTLTRCTEAASVVPPAYYAHLLARRARGYVDNDCGSTTAKDNKTKDKEAAIHTLSEIKDNLKKVMFFC